MTEIDHKPSAVPRYDTILDLLARGDPVEPVYCLYPEVYRQTARQFVAGFPGRVLYAVKANDHPAVLGLLNEGGVKHFDCASVPEVELVREYCPDGTPYFMVPVRLKGAARDAFGRLGVRHFMVDHAHGTDLLAAEIDLRQVVVFVRMAVHHDSALQDLSSKFGAPPADVPELLEDLRKRGAEPALAFNVGSSVMQPEAYLHAIRTAEDVLKQLSFRVRLVDIGGGFPLSYPGFAAPPLSEYHRAIREAAIALPLAAGGELMAEPGRALSAPGLSAVVSVLLRKADRLYLNDGMYGIFWELRFKGHKRFPVRSFRGGQPLEGDLQSFQLYGPTCDATDVMPGRVELPAGIREGDVLEFGQIGAYSLAGRTRFNGFYSDRLVQFTGPLAQPPGDPST
jgi:ornithine decarboxylase